MFHTCGFSIEFPYGSHDFHQVELIGCEDLQPGQSCTVACAMWGFPGIFRAARRLGSHVLTIRMAWKSPFYQESSSLQCITTLASIPMDVSKKTWIFFQRFSLVAVMLAWESATSDQNGIQWDTLRKTAWAPYGKVSYICYITWGTW